MNNSQIVMLIFSAAASMFSALCSGFVLWSIDRLLKDLHGRISSVEGRVDKVETVLMERNA